MGSTGKKHSFLLLSVKGTRGGLQEGAQWASFILGLKLQEMCSNFCGTVTPPPNHSFYCFARNFTCEPGYEVS